VRTLADVRAWLDRSLDRERTPGAFGLGGVARLLDALGRPDRACPVVHVAGTKGKGTTAAAVASILDAAGLRVGLYTSPHLVDVRERIRVGAGPLPDPAWVEAARAVDAALGPGPRPSWFELMTALALVAFRAAAVDVAVLEVGLGGRLDATNLVDPAVSVVTRIGLDHTDLLGEALEAVAAEKAAILKPGVPAVAGPGSPEAAAVVVERARAVGGPLWLLGRDVHLEDLGLGPAGRRLRITTPSGAREVTAPLGPGGPAANAALAVAAVERLGERLGRDLEPGVAPGLARLRWRGRGELLPGDPPLVLDGAHEAAAARALVAAARERLGERPLILLLGVARDKDLGALLDALAPAAAEVVATASRSPRARDPERLAGAVRRRGVEATAVAGVAEALAEARRRARGLGGAVVTAGSLYVVGEVLAALGQDALAAWTST